MVFWFYWQSVHNFCDFIRFNRFIGIFDIWRENRHLGMASIDVCRSRAICLISYKNLERKKFFVTVNSKYKISK